MSLEPQWKRDICLRIDNENKTILELGDITDIAMIRSSVDCVRDFIIKRSKRLPTQNGIFACRTYEKNEIVTFYDGKIIPYQQDIPFKLFTHAKTLASLRFMLLGNVHPNHLDQENLNSYSLLLSDDAQNIKHLGGGAFINHSSFDPNVYFFHIDSIENEWKSDIDPKQRIQCIVANQTINPGDELLIDYGHSFWSRSIDQTVTNRLSRRKIQRKEQVTVRYRRDHKNRYSCLPFVARTFH
jgi:SET domain-containing protein